MNSKLLIVIALCVNTLTACTSSQKNILGEASTTTEAVLKEVNNSSRISLDEFLRLDTDIRTSKFNVRQGIAELAPRVKYQENPNRILYFFPRRTALGSIEPGYAIEYPTYKEVHIIRP